MRKRHPEARRPGLRAKRGHLPLALYGFTGEDRVAEADYAARAIAQNARARLEAVSGNYALPVDYADFAGRADYPGLAAFRDRAR